MFCLYRLFLVCFGVFLLVVCFVLFFVFFLCVFLFIFVCLFGFVVVLFYFILLFFIILFFCFVGLSLFVFYIVVVFCFVFCLGFFAGIFVGFFRVLFFFRVFRGVLFVGFYSVLKMQFSVYFRMLSLLDTYTAEVSSHVSFSTENINIAAVDVSRDDVNDVDFTPRLADGNLTVDVSVRHVTSFC